VRNVLRRRAVNVLSMNPFVKLDAPGLDFERICQETGQASFIENKDIPRGITLTQDNIRYFKLTLYIIGKNLRHWARKFSR